MYKDLKERELTKEKLKDIYAGPEEEHIDKSEEIDPRSVIKEDYAIGIFARGDKYD